MPGYFASNALPSFSPTGRSIDEYNITLASLRAASTRSGVIEAGSGPAAFTVVANAARPKAAEPLMTLRRVMDVGIARAFCSSLRAERSNPVRKGKKGLLRRGACHWARRRRDPVAPGNDGFRR